MMNDRGGIVETGTCVPSPSWIKWALRLIVMREKGRLRQGREMGEREVNERIIARGRELLKGFEGEKPAVFERGRFAGKIMGWSLRHDDLRTRMFRFVDVFPALSTPASLTRHLREYFDVADAPLPALLKWGARAAARGGWLRAFALTGVIRYGIRMLGEQFIAEETTLRTIRKLAKVRKAGCAFSVDILGEAVLGEAEADGCACRYMSLVSGLQEAEREWIALDGGGTLLDWGHAPKINVSIKPSSLYSQVRPQAFEDSVEGILARLRPIYEKVIEVGGTLTIDMESYQYKEITLELYKRLRLRYAAYPHLVIVLQAYLKETERDLLDLLGWSSAHGLTLAVRLVKGAYWDYEMMRAMQNGWEIPVYTRKAETDAAFERLARLILRNHEHAYLGCGSHNIRSIAAVLEWACVIGAPDRAYEFQVLYGMAEPVRKVLLAHTGRVRLYCPSGPIVPGMAYLVRRLLENTANQSFLRLMFAGRVDMERLLQDPSEPRGETRGATPTPGTMNTGTSAGATGSLPPFGNQPSFDFTKKEEREQFSRAITTVRGKLGRTLPLFIDGKDRTTADMAPSVNPANPEEVIANVCQAGRGEAEEAIGAAESAFRMWRDVSPAGRAEYLIRAAKRLRERSGECAAWQTLEIGKQWDQASADVAEAIDFLEYYAREMVRLGPARRLASPPGEINHYSYEPRGVAVVIAPWNFPLAISCGMVSAAIVTGNCVVYKPSPLTPVIGHQLVDAFRAAGLPSGVFNFVPGRTEIIAEMLIDHPAVSTIAFTGSTEVGLSIIEHAALVRPGQEHVKRVITEMGGKNAIIIDDDADLDEAIPAVLVSAFGFQGQKCSSCSRVIVLDSIYDAFIARLVEAVAALRVGPPEDPAFSIGPVADGAAMSRIMKYIGIAKEEGTLLFSGNAPTGGNYAPITIVGDIQPEHRVAREEIFGPVLAIMRAKDFDEALQWADSTRFALTGGVFSRSPLHLEEARKRFRVGNLYLNRQITGALVGRQPFGGLRMSGLGTRAGGDEYLLHFMDPRVVTENTARRGFSPDMV